MQWLSIIRKVAIVIGVIHVPMFLSAGTVLKPEIQESVLQKQENQKGNEIKESKTIIQNIKRRLVIFKNNIWGTGSFSEHYIRRLCALAVPIAGICIWVRESNRSAARKIQEQKERERLVREQKIAQLREQRDRSVAQFSLAQQQLGEALIGVAGNWDAESEQEAWRLISLNAPVNYQNEHGETPLIEAAKVGTSSMVRLLLAQGAAVNMQDNEGNTAYMRAYQTKELRDFYQGDGESDALIASLYAAHADITVRNVHGLTAFDMERAR